MLVVSDTSPIRALQTVGLLDLIRALYGGAVLPPAVATELLASTPTVPAIDPSRYAFFTIQSPTDQRLIAELRQVLDAGESEAIALAVEIAADAVLVDEWRGRHVAANRGLRVIVEAKRVGLVAAVAPLITRLRQDIDFRVSDEIVAVALRIAGE
jgi:predicted nucleic acid-binding protein